MNPSELFDDAVKSPQITEGQEPATEQAPAPEATAAEAAAPAIEFAPEDAGPGNPTAAQDHIADKLDPKKVLGELHRLITYAQNAPLTKRENFKELQPGESEPHWIAKDTPITDPQRDRGLRALKVLDRKQLLTVCTEFAERETYRALVEILAEAWGGGIPKHLFT